MFVRKKRAGDERRTAVIRGAEGRGIGNWQRMRSLTKINIS